jgi:hypothetical protein
MLGGGLSIPGVEISAFSGMCGNFSFILAFVGGMEYNDENKPATSGKEEEHEF